MTTYLAVAAMAALVAGHASADRGRSEPAFLVIVHESNPATSLDRKFLADAFLRKTTRWGNDRAIVPVDQRPQSTVRRRFSRAVLKRSVQAVRNYWRQLVFSGRGVPPRILASDEAVVGFVRKHRGAIGYVSPKAELSGVKAVRVR